MQHWLSSDTFLMPLALSFMEDLLSLCSFITSHPLQLAYLIFFSTHIFNLFMFFHSPLLLTTLLFLSTADPLHLPSLGSTTLTLISTALSTSQDLSSDSQLVCTSGFMGPILFELETCADSVEKAYADCTAQAHEEMETDSSEEAERSVPISGVIGWDEFEAIGKLYKALSHEMGEYPLKLAIQNLKKKQLSASEIDLVKVEEGKVAPLKEGWETPGSELDDLSCDGSPTSIMREAAQPCWVDAKSSGLDRFGSLRKGREWKRTLACKLYEERWVKGDDLEDEECMDVLWEEHDDIHIKKKNRDSKKKMMTMMMNSTSRKNRDVDKEENGTEQTTQVVKFEEEKQREEDECDDGDGDDDDGDDDVVGAFCCLQALKFSTKRMRFGMGKMKSLMKVSKAIKGGVGLIRNQSRRSKGD